MGRVHVCINEFEEGDLLAGAIASARRCAPHAIVVVVDGAYERFPHPNGPESSDGSLDVARKLADVVIRCPTHPDGRAIAWRNEEVKRSAYFVGREGDWYVVLDADEEIVGRVPDKFPAPDMDVTLIRDDETPKGRIFRIHAHRDGMAYRGTHHSLWVGDDLVNSRKRPLAEGFHLFHHYTKRTAEKMRRKGIYYEWLVNHEREFRSSHRFE